MYGLINHTFNMRTYNLTLGKRSMTNAMKSLSSTIFILCSSFIISCSDKWDDHYTEDTELSGTLWTAIQQNEQLSNFCRVLQATGYDARLNSSQMFTVFAPTNDNFSQEEAETLISRFQAEKQSGTRDADNSVIRQFVQNHIALFNQSVSSLTNDSLLMMNGKYEVVTSSNFGSTNLLSSNQYFANGVLFTINQPETYYANVFEYLSQSGRTDSIAHFLNSYSVYEFDPEESVAGDIIDGKTVYLDSVFHLTNSMLSTYGHINREDSSYMALVPTDEAWRQMFDEYINYFNYNDLTSKRDSMVMTHTRRAIADGTIFNLNSQKSSADSLISTSYESLYKNKANYTDQRYYVYYRPNDNDGVLSGADKIDCSNGLVCIQPSWKIDKRQTFYQQIKVEAEQTINVDTIIQAREPLSQRTVPLTNPFYGKVSENSFIEAQPLSSVSSTSVTYTIPDQLSNIGYDIYAVFVPAIAYNENATDEDRLPCRVRFTLTYQDQDGTEQSESMRNPVDNTVNYETTPDVVDSVLVVSNFIFPTCALDLDDPQVTLRIQSNLTSSMSSRFTRTLRLDCLILRPHEDQ